MHSEQTPSFCAILLAAGEGSRLGRIPKSLFRLEHESLLVRQLLALTAAGADDIVLVTGYFHQAIEAEAQAAIQRLNNKLARIHLVRNHEPQRDQQSSVLLGLQARQDLQLNAAPNKQAYDEKSVMIALADQPLMEANDYRACINFFQHRTAGRSMIHPVVGQSRGNPVVLDSHTVGQVLESGQSCKAFIDTHPEQVQHFTSDNDHYIFDIDAPCDLQTFQQRTGFTLIAPLTF
jgi:molybdenum cofactor cytidylyltransferase/nicotine blue oxidoreductase